MGWMDRVERMLFVFAMLLIGAIIGSQLTSREYRKDIGELREQVTYLKQFKINDNGDVIVIEKGDR